MVVADVAATRAARPAKGYEPVPVNEFKRGDELLARFFFIRDPDGYKIETVERYGPYQCQEGADANLRRRRRQPENRRHP